MATTLEPVVPARPFHFNLKSLLLVITIVGIVLTPVKWFGGAYLVSAALSVALVIGCERAYHHLTGGAALGVALVAVIIGIPLIMIAAVFISHAFLNFVLCILLVLCHVRPTTFAVMTAGLAVGLYAIVLWDGYERVRELTALREQHPFVSLEERLAFERKEHLNDESAHAPLPLAPTVEANLNEQEQNRHYSRYYDRAWALQELHEDISAHFARAAGFGISRMGGIYPRRVELEPRQPLKLPATLSVASQSPLDAEFYPVYEKTLNDFSDAGRMGYVRSRGAVAGFESHGVSSLGSQMAGCDDAAKYWQVERLELVSLLRHDEPRVYVADSLPQMDQLADVPHRALNEFEASALSQLETAEDLVIDQQQPGRIQMLGAVRAAKSCLECHAGRRGKLLGAFSYEITPVVNTAQAAK